MSTNLLVRGPHWRWTPRLFQLYTVTGRPAEERWTVTDFLRIRVAASKNVRPSHRARLVVVAGEVAGQWSEEAASFIQLAKARARTEPLVFVKRAEQAWRLRLFSMLACAAARAFTGSLLDRRFALDGV